MSYGYIAVKRHHRKLYKGKHLTGSGLQFGGLVRRPHGGKRGGVLADTGLGRMLRGLHRDLQAGRRE